MSLIPSMEKRLSVVKHTYLGFQVICFSAKKYKNFKKSNEGKLYKRQSLHFHFY